MRHFRAKCAISSSFSDHAAWCSDSHYLLVDCLIHQTTSANHRTITDLNTAQHGAGSPDPHAIFDRNMMADARPGCSLRPAVQVSSGNQKDSRRQIASCPDPHGRIASHDRYLVPQEGVCANRYWAARPDADARYQSSTLRHVHTSRSPNCCFQAKEARGRQQPSDSVGQVSANRQQGRKSPSVIVGRGSLIVSPLKQRKLATKRRYQLEDQEPTIPPYKLCNLFP